MDNENSADLRKRVFDLREKTLGPLNLRLPLGRPLLWTLILLCVSQYDAVGKKKATSSHPFTVTRNTDTVKANEIRAHMLYICTVAAMASHG